MSLSVILPTHNPHSEWFRRTMEGLRGQTLPPELWELVVVDNASTRIPDARSSRATPPQISSSSTRRSSNSRPLSRVP